MQKIFIMISHSFQSDFTVRAVTPPPPQLPPPAVVESPPPVMIQRKPSVNIDSMLEELEETDMSSSATNNIDSTTEYVLLV